MAEQVLVQVRVDKKLKEEVSEIYEMLGLDLPTAIRMFLVRSKLERGLPFTTRLPKETVTRPEALADRSSLFCPVGCLMVSNSSSFSGWAILYSLPPISSFFSSDITQAMVTPSKAIISSFLLFESGKNRP